MKLPRLFSIAIGLGLITVSLASAQERPISLGQSEPVSISMHCGSKPNSAQKPLCIVVTAKKEIEIPMDSLKLIHPNWIRTIRVLKDSVSNEKYAYAGRNGTILITIHEEKLPQTLKALHKQF